MTNWQQGNGDNNGKEDKPKKKRAYRPRKPRSNGGAEQQKEAQTNSREKRPAAHGRVRNPNTDEKLKLIFLGGVDEIGKNCTAIEYGDDMIVVDCGLIFPDDEMLGIDMVIPDMTYLEKNAHKLRAVIITHGHEDHIGALPYFYRMFKVPLYGTRLTCALVEHKMNEHRIQGVDFRVIKASDKVSIGAFEVEFIKVTHSISGAVALGITTPLGTLVHTGDFKVDFTPPSGEVTDLVTLANLGEQGVLALLAESTNIERRGYTLSEQKVGETFDSYFRNAKGRIIIATFASNIHRIQQIIDTTVKYGRKLCFAGRSMINISNIAIGLGDLNVPSGMVVDLDHVNSCPESELVILTTGSQGEPMSGLVRMAGGEHNRLEVHTGDLVIISANPIPGNEKFVSRVINQLYKRGAQVIYEALADVHVSGHACREELKLVHTLVKPRYFIPVHGEYRHMFQHSLMAQSLGMDEDRIFLPNLGNVIEFTSDGDAYIAGTVPSGSVLVDGLGIGDVGSVVLRDRKVLSQDGLLVAVLTISSSERRIVAGPDLISRGFVYVRESDDLLDDARDVVRDSVEDSLAKGNIEWNAIKNNVRSTLRGFLYQRTRRNPMILPVVMEVD